MKKNKFILASVAALMAIGSVLSFGSQAHTVQAAQKTIHTNYYAGIKSTALSYNVNGKSLSSGIKTNTTMKYYGNPRLIKGQKYVCYNVGKGKYVPLNSIGKVNGRNTFRLLNNSYIYNASGVVFRKQCFEQIKDLSCFSMRYSGDWLFWIEMARQGSVIELYEKLNFFRLHSTSTTVEGNASGNAILEDIQVVHYVESFSYPIGRYKRLMRHGMLYKNIKRAKVDPKMRLLLFEKLKGCFGTSVWTYRWERVNKYMSFLNPWQPTRDRDRL